MRPSRCRPNLFVDTSKDTGQNGEEHLPEESYFTNTYVFPLRTLSSPANEEYQHLIDGTPTDDTTSPSDGLQVKADSIKKSPGAREETPLEEFAFPPKLVFAKDSLSSQYFGTPTSIPRKDSDAIQFSFAEHGKRFTIIGLCGECRSFDTIDLLWSYIKEVYTSRYDNLLRRSSDPDFLMNHLHEFHKLVPYVEPLWIDIQQPSVEDMLIVQDHFGIHPTTIDDCLTDRGSEGEKWEHFEEYLAIVLAAMSVSSTNQLSSIKITETALSTKGLTSLNMILFDDIIITVHSQPIAGMELVMRRIEKEARDDICAPQRTMTISTVSDNHESTYFGHLYRSNALKYELGSPDDLAHNASLPAGADWILYAILDALCDRYLPNIDIIMKQVDRLDTSIMDADGFQERETILARLGYIKKTVNALGRMLKQKQRIGLELISRQIRVIKPNIQISLHDVVDRLTLAKDRLDEAASSLDYINQNFLIKLQVRRMHSITYKREMMKTVTYISAFTFPADVMIQYMSFSFKTPGRGESKSILWWFVSLICIFAISFGILLWVMREFNRLVPKVKKPNTNRSLRAWWPAGLPGFKKQNSIIKSS